MDKSEILTRFESDLWRSSASVRKARLFYARLFLDFAGDSAEPWNKSTVINFLKWIERQEYSKGTCRQIYSITRRVFDAARAVADEGRQRAISSVDPDDPGAVRGILQALATPLPSWPMGKRDAPRVGSEDVEAPALSPEEVEAMIALAHDGQLSPSEAGFLAVATTFGPRREELLRIRPEHLNWKERTIYIDTCKGGEPRFHAIPSEIEQPLRAYGFGGTYSLFKLSRMYLTVEQRAGILHRPGAGFHSIRRRLDTCLIDRLGEVKTKVFLRWKLKASSEMPRRYYTAEQAKIDAEVFEVHPFLYRWRQDSI